MNGCVDNLLKERLKLAIRKRRTSARKVSLDSGFGPDLVRDVMRGRATSPRAEALTRIAQILRTSVGYLTGETDVFDAETEQPDVLSAKVIGRVQAGAFAEVDMAHDDDDGARYIPTVEDPDFPHLQQVAFEVVGDSIDRRCLPGGFAVCVNFADAGVALRNGMWVVAERQIGPLIETTVKQVRRDGDGGFTLLPDSTNPRHKAISFPSSEPHEEVRVIALVRRFVGPLLSY